MAKEIRKLEFKTLLQFCDSDVTYTRIYDSEIAGLVARKNRGGSVTVTYNYTNIVGHKDKHELGKIYPKSNTGTRRRPHTLSKHFREEVQEHIVKVRSGADLALKREAELKQKEKNNESQRLKVLAYFEYVHKERIFSETANPARAREKVADFYNNFQLLHDLYLDELSHSHFENWAHEMIADKCMARTTVRRKFGFFTGLIRRAIGSKIDIKNGKFIDKDPFVGFSISSYMKSMGLNTENEVERQFKLKASRKILTDYEELSILQALDEREHEKREQRRRIRKRKNRQHLTDFDKLAFVDWWKPAYLLFFYQGIRPMDIIKMEWKHIDFARQKFSFIPSKTSKKKGVIEEFPIHKDYLPTLKSWHKQCGEPTSGPVFESTKHPGNPLSEGIMSDNWVAIRKRANLPEELELYTLRHNFISRLLRKNVSVLTVAKLASTSIEMIEKNYGDVLESDLLQAINMR